MRINICLNHYSILIILTTLSGCSPYIYKESITNLSTAISNVSNTGSTASKLMIDLKKSNLEEKMIENKEAVITKPNLCIFSYNQEIQTCSIDLKNPITEKDDQVFFYQQNLYTDTSESLSKQKNVLKFLDEYSLALNKITNAKDQDALEQAASTLAISTANLVKAKYQLEGHSKATVNEAAYKSSAAILSNISGIYLNNKRYKVLRASVQQVNPILSTLVEPIGLSLVNAKMAQLNFLSNRIENTTKKLNKNPTISQYNTLLNLLKQDVSDVNLLNMSDPEKTVEELVSTHNALNESLKHTSWSNKGQFNNFTEQVASLVKDTQDLKSSLKQEN